MRTSLKLLSPRWCPVHSSGKGTLVVSGTVLGCTEAVYSATGITQIVSELSALNGFYALIREEPGRLVAAVDHIRSIPLFYGQANGELFLSDSAEWVRAQAGDREIDPVAAEEFQLAGYVTGSDTLFPNVKQIQAGECLVVTDDGSQIQQKTTRYYRFWHTEPDDFYEPDLRKSLHEVALASMQRLIDYADGRQIVVPLSGGYDSRLVVTLLRRLGCENILTFSYGMPGNKESQYSKRVAEALDLPWYFVEYSEELWRELWHSAERWQYQKWASGWSSLSHIQDWPAVKALKEQGVLEADCVFAPGHTGDFVSGGHIPLKATQDVPVSHQDLTDAVLEKHYSLAPLKLVSKQPRSFWGNKIRSLSEYTAVKTSQDLANASEKWEWQERQAKYICNSIRVYEYFDYDWWLPLWDKKFVEFWEGVPLVLRVGRGWYINYVEEKFFSYSTSNKTRLKGNAARSNVAKTLIRNGARQIPGGSFSYRLLKRIIGRKSHPLGFYGGHESSSHKKLSEAGYTIFGLQAYDFLESLREDDILIE